MYLYDAQITLPKVAKETVSYAAGAGLPWLAFMLTLIGVEFGIMFRKQTLGQALQAFVHTLLWGITVFMIVLCITEVTKPYAGRLRPDFMDRCNPAAAQRAGVLDPFEVADCQNKEGEEIKDGRLSFPSGHSSNSMSICLFGTLYMAYSMFWRGGRTFMDSIHGHDNIWMRVIMEVVYPILFFLNLLVFLCAWFIGVSQHTSWRGPGCASSSSKTAGAAGVAAARQQQQGNNSTPCVMPHATGSAVAAAAAPCFDAGDSSACLPETAVVDMVAHEKCCSASAVLYQDNMYTFLHQSHQCHQVAPWQVTSPPAWCTSPGMCFPNPCPSSHPFRRPCAGEPIPRQPAPCGRHHRRFCAGDAGGAALLHLMGGPTPLVCCAPGGPGPEGGGSSTPSAAWRDVSNKRWQAQAGACRH